MVLMAVIAVLCCEKIISLGPEQVGNHCKD